MNYNDFITINDSDMDKYHAKFKFVDEVKALANPHPKYLKRIWDDPTMFAYMFLKNNLTIKGLMP